MHARILISVLPYTLGFWLGAVGGALAQQPPPVAPPLQAESSPNSSVLSLEALYKSILSKQREVSAIQSQLLSSPDEVTRAELLDSLRRVKEEEDRLNRQFMEFAVGVDISDFQQRQEESFDWEQELGAILQPILDEIKSATSESRIVSQLRSDIEDIADLHETAEAAVANLEELAENSMSPELAAHLASRVDEWTRRRDDLANRLTALEHQLDNRMSTRKSILDSTTGYAETFVRTRGLNLLLGVLGFCAVFFGIRWLGALIRRLGPSRKAGSFSTRVGALVFQFASVAGGILATLIVFNLVGDWFLLGIVILFLLGVGWAGIKTLPQQIETVKLMLNIGAVREGERIVMDGTPWKLDSLSLAARLVNPELEGGVMTLPVRLLVGMHSRPPGPHEEWFPCRAGDWVVLADGRSGRIAYQTPSAVQVVELGGSQTMYQTPDFLAQTPKVLSTGYRIEVPFGIDFAHRSEATSTIPARMQEAVAAGLASFLDPKLIQHVSVEFARAGSSSLDLCALVDLHGDTAPQWESIERSIHRILVDACNQYNWHIPFPQLTVHTAQSDGPRKNPSPAKK